jgi:2-polyprenyl-6-hydroxyphenyl methylase/3-demethylubiquinone-9 3-methyltransferase
MDLNVNTVPTHDPQRERQELRFAFGKNWSNYLATLNPQAIEVAREALMGLLKTSSLAGTRFLDIGCGSGLSSLVARQQGAIVTSFDYDRDSVGCTEYLRDRFAPDDALWSVRQGSILDKPFVEMLGLFDVVYSWGVLHHTGGMWDAIDNAATRVRSGGRFAIAIYNDQGHRSRIWLSIKRIYNKLPRPLRIPFVVAIMLPRELRSLAFAVLTLQPGRYLRSWTQYRRFRGMSKWHDLVDWVGGLPFEVAKPEEIIFFMRDRGFALVGMTTCCGEIGCNEYVFDRLGATSEGSVCK